MNRVTVKLFDKRNKFISADVFEGDDIERIAGDVSYQLRIEVTPYWKENTLRMETEIDPESDTTELLRAMLRGVAIAWRMIPSQDPADRTEEETSK